MSSYAVKSYEQIISDMVAWVVANSPNITDLSPGSVIRSFCEGASLSIEEAYVAANLGFKRNLNDVPSIVFDFPRKSGTKASTNVVFTRSGTTGISTIPANTRLKTSSGLRFILSDDTYITDGNTDSDPSEVVADSVGTAYNVAAGTIIVFEDDVSGVDSVTNASAAVGGVNSESFISFKSRFQQYIEGLGRSNVSGYKAAALSVEGITSVSVVELFPPVGNINVEVYVDDGSAGGVSDSLISEVQSVIDGDGTEDNPGYRSAGIKVEVKKPTIVTQNIVAILSTVPGIDIDQIESDVGTALTDYLNTLELGSDIIYNELIAAIMSVFGVIDVSLTTPSSNVSISSSQVGRIGTVALSEV
jgi:uncharacterized phage protein gp47/JayE